MGIGVLSDACCGDEAMSDVSTGLLYIEARDRGALPRRGRRACKSSTSDSASGNVAAFLSILAESEAAVELPEATRNSESLGGSQLLLVITTSSSSAASCGCRDGSGLLPVTITSSSSAGSLDDVFLLHSMHKL